MSVRVTGQKGEGGEEDEKEGKTGYGKREIETGSGDLSGMLKQFGGICE